MTYGPKNKESLSHYYEKNLKRIQQVYRELISNYNEKKEFLARNNEIRCF